jgi:hypothetical protein
MTNSFTKKINKKVSVDNVTMTSKIIKMHSNNGG